MTITGQPGGRVQRVVIAGGGTAGWMTAAAFGKLLGKQLDITLVESDQIGTIGVGEATIPTLHLFHDVLGLNEADVMKATNATFKLGIKFENWRQKDQDYIHSFGYLGQDHWAAGFQHFWLKGQQLGFASQIGDYCKEHIACEAQRFAVSPNQDRNHALHLDATAYAKFLREFAEKHGVKRVEGKIRGVDCFSDGDIASLQMESGDVIEGDLFIDCSGFRGLLIEETLNAGYHDWSHWLPCDRALAVQTSSVESPIPYTRSIAHGAGWQWRIPLQNRVGNGLVYSSRFCSDDEARATLLGNIEGETQTEPRAIKFRTGTRRKHWHRNCVAIGLSSGFIEPLESTSIHLIQRSVLRLLQLFPYDGIESAVRDEFNEQSLFEMHNILDFIVLHYHVTERNDTAFWRHCRNMQIPDSLQHRLDMFSQSGRVYKHGAELFGEASWLQVMIGQGMLPQHYHPAVDMMSNEALQGFLENIKSSFTKQVAAWPKHEEFLQHYCPAKRVAMA